MKKIVLAVLAFFILGVGAFAQDNIPAYRTPGYKGEVSLSSLGLYWNGVETSHGYMFNDRFYLGAGAGVLFGAVWDFTVAARAFADAKVYWLPRESTLTTRVRAGYLRNFYGESDMFEGSLALGWSWGLKAGYGISFEAGMSVLVPPGITLAAVNQPCFSLAPVLSLTFEF